MGSAPPAWLDDAGLEDATLLVTGDRLWTATARTIFWNRAIDEVLRVRPATLPFPPVTPAVEIGRRRRPSDGDGRPARPAARRRADRRSRSRARRSPSGRPANSETYGLDGVARRDVPVRVLVAWTGFLPNGDFGGRVTDHRLRLPAGNPRRDHPRQDRRSDPRVRRRVRASAPLETPAGEAATHRHRGAALRERDAAVHLRAREPGLRRDDDDRLRRRAVAASPGTGRPARSAPRSRRGRRPAPRRGRGAEPARRRARRGAPRPLPRASPRSRRARAAPAAPPPRRRSRRPSTWTSSLTLRTLHRCRRRPSAPARHELRRASLGERDVDQVEVARDDRPRERARSASLGDLRARRSGPRGASARAGRRPPRARRAPPRPRSSAPSRAPVARSSARNVASWTSTSAPVAASTTDGAAPCRRSARSCALAAAGRRPPPGGRPGRRRA